MITTNRMVSIDRREVITMIISSGFTLSGGCVGDSADTSNEPVEDSDDSVNDNSNDSDPQIGANNRDEAANTFEIDIESIDIEGNADFSAAVLHDITPDHHGQLSVGLINELDEPVRVKSFGGNVNTAGPFHPVRFYEINGKESILVRVDSSPEQVGDCWITHLETDDGLFEPELEPGEAVENEVGVFTRTIELSDDVEDLNGPCGVSGT